jgi:BirA family biotin operon repressor/biotin-[acetyl-CoA-carboxylase] ligase
MWLSSVSANVKEVSEAVSIFDEVRNVGAVDEGFTVFTCSNKAAVGRLKPVKEGGLWFAVLVYPRQSATTSPLLILTTALSVVEGVAKTTGLQPLLRWPNEVSLHGSVVAAASVEMEVVNDTIARAFAGAGIYVNSKPTEHETSIAEQAGGEIDHMLLLENILQSFTRNYHLYKEGWRVELLDRIRDMLEYVRTVVSVNLSQGTQLIGFLEGLDELGRLILRVDQERIPLAPADVESVTLF